MSRNDVVAHDPSVRDYAAFLPGFAGEEGT